MNSILWRDLRENHRFYSSRRHSGWTKTNMSVLMYKLYKKLCSLWGWKMFENKFCLNSTQSSHSKVNILLKNLKKSSNLNCFFEKRHKIVIVLKDVSPGWVYSLVLPESHCCLWGILFMNFVVALQSPERHLSHRSGVAKRRTVEQSFLFWVFQRTFDFRYFCFHSQSRWSLSRKRRIQRLAKLC